MNKPLILLLISFITIIGFAGQPVLEISEFGKSQPVIRKVLNGREQNFSGENWSCRVQKMSGKVTSWNLKFSSKQHEPVRLKFKFILPLDFSPTHFWDGHEERSVSKLPLERVEYLDAFPLAVANNGSRGMALGFAPQNILSSFQRMLSKEGLSLEARIVVDDRRVQEIDVVEYSFLPEFGWRNAVEDYQNAFIKWFVPHPEVDPRIYGVSGYLIGGNVQRPFVLHSQRYHKLSWEWTYAPWYESGNWYPVGAGWKKEKNQFWDYFGHRKGKMVTREEYDEAVTREMHYGNKIAAMFYYILVKDIHQNVANAYPEAVQGSSGLHSLPSNRGKSKSVFAPGSPIFDYLKEQIRQVVENYEVSGFSFDMANSSFHFTTKSQLDYAVGRSWYDDGTIFTSDTVAPIPFADYIHTLSRDGKRMGTMFNFADGYVSPFTFFHCDGAIIEGPPYTNIDATLPFRMIMGRKPITFWHWKTYPIQSWRVEGAPEKKAAALLGLKQFYLLKCYELGCNPMNWVSADAYFRPHLTALRAISQAGYHPVNAVKGAEPFWVGRFGEDVDTILTISNSKREKITRTVRVVNRYLGDGKYAFLPVKGKLTQKFDRGETVFEVTLEPKEILVLRTVKINGNISELTAETAKQNIMLKGNGKFTFSLPAEDFDGNQISGAAEKTFSGTAENIASLTLLPAYRVFGNVADMIGLMSSVNYPAVEAGKGQDTQIAAELMAIYRPHVAASMKFRGTPNNGNPGFMDASLAKPDLAVFAPGKGKAGKKICLGTPADFPGFKPPANWDRAFLTMPDANTLWIGGSTPAEVRQAALVYFDLLDKYQTTKVKVDFVRPSGWGGRASFIQGEGQKYLRLVGDPEQKNNSFYYTYYHMPAIQGGNEITFTISCKLEKLTSGKFRVGIYEFSDDGCTKTIRLQAVEVPVSADWQSITKRVKLHQNTKRVRFYVLGQNAGKGDTLLVRSLEFFDNSQFGGTVETAPAATANKNVTKVDFVRPSGWGGRASFIQGEGQKYLRLVGDPEQKNNQFYYTYYHMSKVKGGETISFRASCKLEKLTAGKFRIGIYEFFDAQAMKPIRFQYVDVPVSSDWQQLSKKVVLHKNAKAARFYVLGMNAGKGDTLLVRSLEFERSPEAE